MCFLGSLLKSRFNCFDLSDSDLVSRWEGPLQGHQWLSATPKCVYEMDWSVSCTYVCVYMHSHTVHVLYMMVWYVLYMYIHIWWWTWCMYSVSAVFPNCSPELYSFLARSSAVGECEGTVPQASWTQVPRHGDVCWDVCWDVCCGVNLHHLEMINSQVWVPWMKGEHLRLHGCVWKKKREIQLKLPFFSGNMNWIEIRHAVLLNSNPLYKSIW